MATRAPWPRASDAAVLPAAPAPTTIRSYGAPGPPAIESPFPRSTLHERMTRDQLTRTDSRAPGAAGPGLPWCPRYLLRCNLLGGKRLMPDTSRIGNGDAAVPSTGPIPVLDTLTAAFQHAMVGMAVWTPDSQLIAANRAFSRMFGYEHDEFLAHGFAWINH